MCMYGPRNRTKNDLSVLETSLSKTRITALATAALLATSLSGVAVASASTVAPHAATRSATPAAMLRLDRSVGAISAQQAPGTASTGSPATRLSNAHLDPQTAALPVVGHGLVRVQVTGTGAAKAVTALGGRVLATAAGAAMVLVPKSQLSTLARSAGVADVSTPDLAVTDTAPAPGPSQAGDASGATNWNTAGFDGTGVKLAIVDAGFGSSQSEYDTEVAAGHLGTNPQIMNEDCTDNTSTSTPYDDPHGLQTAELAHQMAPQAQLYLFCINTSVGFMNAANAIIGDGIHLASSSLSFPGDSRGDGTGIATSATAAVEKARKAGVLWIESAGNQAGYHWGGGMADSDHDLLVDIGGPWNPGAGQFEDDVVFVGGSDGVTPTSASIVLQWDQWPLTNNNVSLILRGYQCTSAFSSTGCNAYPIGTSALDGSTLSASHGANQAPVLGISTGDHFPNTSPYDQYWQVSIATPSNSPSLRYDLNYYGELDGPSIQACPTVVNNQCVIAAQSTVQSMSSPADSPYALAVGAADVGADGSTRGTREYFSSEGPTIDGRTKPDITGWDGLSSYLSEWSTGFYGTSAAAPVVAGAAALVLQSNPNLDASQIQTFLEQHASSGSPHNPPTNAVGHGLLTLGTPPAMGVGAQPPTGAQYTAIAPTRVLDTRTAIGGHKAPLGAGGRVTIGFPAGMLPADATAVVVNLTGVGATAPTYVSAYAGGAAFPGTSNLNLASTDSTAAVLAPVTLSGGQTITIRNNAGSVNVVVDVVGYFGTGAETGLFTPLAPGVKPRVLDTRTTVGGHLGKLATGKTITVNPVAPAGATAVVVNVTAVNAGTGGFFNASPMCSSSSSMLNVTKYTRANMAVVQLDPNGKFCLTSGSAPADLIVDVLGFFGSAGAQYYALPAPTRVLDTRTGNGGQTTGHVTPLGSNASQVVYGTGIGEVPTAADGLFTDVVEASTTTGTYLTLFPGSTPPAALSSTINFTAGRIVSNAAIVGTPGSKFGVYNNAGSTNAAVDVFGYFLPTSG